jgi:hypothetical protein
MVYVAYRRVQRHFQEVTRKYKQRETILYSLQARHAGVSAAVAVPARHPLRLASRPGGIFISLLRKQGTSLIAHCVMSHARSWSHFDRRCLFL